MPRYILLASEREVDHEFCQKVAAQAGFSFLAVGTYEGLEKLLETNQCLVFWDVDAPAASDPHHRFSIARLLPVLNKYLKPHLIFGLADHSVFELPEVSRIPSVGHYCVRQYTDFGVEWISQICVPLFSPGPFGVDYYREPGSITQAIELKHSWEKTLALEAVGLILKKNKVEHRASQMLLRTVDELLMNAIFDAPVDAKGIRYRREIGQDTKFELAEKERVTMSILENTRSMVVSVFDHFGSFALPHATQKMQKDYSIFSYKVDPTTKSAGLGLRGIAASGLGTIISCQKSYGTESVIAFPYYRSFKETKTGFRSFSFNIQD